MRRLPANLIPIREVSCHCGNKTALMFGTAKTGHCILCRCDEHGYGCSQTNTGPKEYRADDTFPGCGAFCTLHSKEVRKQRIAELQDHAGKLNMHEGMFNKR